MTYENPNEIFNTVIGELNRLGELGEPDEFSLRRVERQIDTLEKLDYVEFAVLKCALSSTSGNIEAMLEWASVVVEAAGVDEPATTGVVQTALVLLCLWASSHRTFILYRLTTKD